MNQSLKFFPDVYLRDFLQLVEQSMIGCKPQQKNRAGAEFPILKEEGDHSHGRLSA
jgi:hypothetical protein